MITNAHKKRVSSFINSAEQQGAIIVVDGCNIKVDGYENGYFVGATLIDHVTPAMDSY